MQFDLKTIAKIDALKTIAKTHAPQCLAVGAPVLCAVLIVSIAVPLAMWAPIVDEGPALAAVTSRPAYVGSISRPSSFDSRVAMARAYLVQTAQSGYTMSRQGTAVAIGRLHPEFALRLANAVREARAEGLETAGVFSAYRPPAFRVGGFRNKFHSLHAYGLAVDLSGIGRPGSAQARLWYRIASRNDLTCPYGLSNRKEWNHCQATQTKIVLATNPLIRTINAQGPTNLERMWGTAKPLIIKTSDTRTSDPVWDTAKPLAIMTSETKSNDAVAISMTNLSEASMTNLRSDIARLDTQQTATTATRINKSIVANVVKRPKAHRHVRVAVRTTGTPSAAARTDYSSSSSAAPAQSTSRTAYSTWSPSTPSSTTVARP